MKKIIILFLFPFLTLAQNYKYTHNSEHLSSEEVINSITEELKDDRFVFMPLPRKRGLSDNYYHYYQLFYNQIPVEYYVLSFQGNEEDPAFYSQPKDVLPNLKKDEALIDSLVVIEIIKNRFEGKEYAWENEDYVAITQKANSSESINLDPLLLYHKTQDGRFVLHYKVDVQLLEPTERHLLYVNAINGVITQEIDILAHTTGNVSTLYHGNQDLEFDDMGGGNYELTDVTRDNIETYLFSNQSTDYALATIPNSTNITWNSITGDDLAALDVHFASGATHDFLMSKGIQSFDNAGGSIISYVNYGDSNTSRNNAFYNGSVLTYGRGTPGHPLFPTPVASVDVVSHEIAHALTENYGGGLTYYGESGALNEAYSDMISAAVSEHILTYSTLPAANDPFIIGELSTPGGLRSMQNPNSQNHPDTYQGNFWAPITGPDNGGVHTNSSVINYWFYLASSGGTGTNDNGYNYNVLANLDIDTLTEVILESYQLIGPNSTFQDFANATLIVANLLDNNNCVVVPTIVEAWLAVGVDNIQQDCVLLVDIEDPETQVCVSQPETYQVSALTYNTTFLYEWFIDNVSLGNASGSNISPAVVLSDIRKHELRLQVTDPINGRSNSKSIYLFNTPCQIVNVDKTYMKGHRLNTNSQVDIDFRSGRARNVNRTGLWSFEGTIAQTDANGDLLFYVSKETSLTTIQAKLYDRNDTPIMDVPTLLSSFQLGASIPGPNRDVYNIFMNYAHPSTNKSLNRVIVRVDASGNIVSNGTYPNEQPVNFPSGHSYDMNGAIQVHDNTTVIPGCNENQYWILNTSYNTNSLLIYEFNYTTANPDGVLTLAANSGYNGLSSYRSILVSPDGETIITDNKVFSFNREDASINLVQNLSIPSNRKFGQGAFTSTGNFFYGTIGAGIGGGAGYRYLYQLDMSDYSIIELEYSSIYSGQDIIRGPDDLIYYRSPSQELNVINYPDQSAHNIQDLGINRNYILSLDYFPRYIEGARPTPVNVSYDYFLKDCNEVTFKATTCKNSYIWDFGDGSPVQVSTENEVDHVYSGPGSYTVSLTSDLAGTTQTFTDIIDVPNPIPPNILGDILPCEVNSTFTTDTVAASYNWTLISGNGTITNSTAATMSLTYGTDSIYELQLEIIDLNGCVTSSRITIRLCADINFTSSSSCVGDDVTFILSSGLNPTSVLWNFDDPTSSSNTSTQLTPIHRFVSSGSYNVTVDVTDSGGTTQYTEIVTIYESPVIPVLNPLELCDDLTNDGIELFNLNLQNNAVIASNQGTNLQLDYFTSQQNADDYVNSLPTSYMNITSPEIIYVRLTNLDTGCYDTAFFDIVVVPLPVIDLPDLELCAGETVTVDAPLGFDFYNWSTQEATQSIEISQAGTYNLSVSNGFGQLACSATTSFTVTQSEPPVITDVDYEGYLNGTMDLEIMVSGSGTYEYSLDGSNYQSSPIFQAVPILNYEVYARDVSGCGQSTFDVSTLFIPNFFTPNNDNYHDYWQVQGPGRFLVAHIYIFDRYGKLLKELKPTGIGWDGMYNGNPLPSSDYWYVVELIDGTVYKNNFSLKR